MRQKGAAFPFHHNYNSAGEDVPLSSEEDKQKYELDFANKVGLHIQASSMLHSNYDECGTDVIISANTYTVCNGLSNQLLGHAAYVANLIKSGKKVAIPDAFIVNGVQSEKNEDGQTLNNIIPTKENSVPLTSIIEGNTLLSKIRQLGGEACFVPYDLVVATNEEQKKDMKCSWLEQLRLSDDDIALSLLESMKPSNPLQDIVNSVISNIEHKSPDSKVSDGVCLHHRDGPDWHKHCSIWKGNNCMNAENMAIEDLVKYRLPDAYPKKWMYYVGDATPSPTLVEAVKEKTNLQLFYRDEDELADNDEIGKLVGYKEPSVETHRDIYAAVDFFVCKSLSSFIGNSVSTFSAAQTALRRGSNSSWYNSRSIPLLADFLKVGVIPVVYTYTEQSQAMGKVLLKTSITSVRRTFGLNIDINVIYHGTEDKMFLKWLEERHVIVHIHEPKWLGMLHDMVSHADEKSSHLYAHIGNYIGTWQRIDIPLFIDAEYIIFLDSDTVVRNKFDLSDFGKEITPGIAFSKEHPENVELPTNAGVAIMNVPKLRETHTKFLEFIQEHAAKKQDFVLGPSDQGAYLDFYGSYETGSGTGVIRRKHGVSKYVKYLDAIFNVKPYYKKKETFDNRKIIHYHGLKPHDIIKALMGYHLDNFAPAVRFLYPTMFDGVVQPLCLTLRDFAISVVEEEDNLEQFCHLGFPSIAKDEIACKSFLEKLSQEETGFDCEGLMESYGYHRDVSLVSRSEEECSNGYLDMYPDVSKAVKEGKLQSGFQHWIEHGKREGRTPYCKEWLQPSQHDVGSWASWTSFLWRLSRRAV